MNYTNDIRDYLALEIEILKKLDVEQINAALNLLDETRQKKGRIYICRKWRKCGDCLAFPE